jgi:chloramphenicol 3-O phosphotransferase
MSSGHVVIINGTSSSGKSTIAEALQELMEEPYLHSGIDHFLKNFPGRIVTYTDGAHAHLAQAEGWLAVINGNEIAEVRIGPLGYRILGGMYRAIAALAQSGINVIVDDVIYDPRVLQLAVEALRECDVFFVGLRLPLEVAEQRERERGDRAPGGARAFYDRVHQHGVYDLELDVATLTPSACAAQIAQGLASKSSPGPGAFAQLWEQMCSGSRT